MISLQAIARAACVAYFAAALAPLPAFAQQPYPSKPVRYVVPYPPGGSTDPMARFVAAKLTERWGQSVIVDNRPGGNTVIGMDFIAKAPPDGYTIGWGGAAMFSTAHLIPNMPYDAVRDLTGVATIGQDVTDRRRVEALKDQVIAIVGHEVRSPMGAVRGALQVLARRLKGLAPQEQQLLDMAIRNTDRSLQLASDLLDYERLAAGATTLDRQVVSAGALLAHAGDVVGVAAAFSAVP